MDDAFLDEMVSDLRTDALVTRRAWIAASSGLLVAAGGLFLPEWLQDADAREGAYGGRLGGRHGKNRRGVDHAKRRDRKDRSRDRDRDRGKAPGRGLFRNTALTVESNCCTGSAVNCTFYYRTKTGLDDYGSPIKALTVSVGKGEKYRFAPDHFRVAAMIEHSVFDGYKYYADVRNIAFDYPKGLITRGPNLDPPHNQFGDSWLEERTFDQGSNATVGLVELERYKDSDDFIEFTFRIR